MMQRLRELFMRLFFIFLLAATSVALVGCSSDKDKAPAAPPPVPVSIATATQKDVPVQVKAVGKVEALSVVDVRSQLSGTLADVHFAEGQDVEKGTLLFTIDPRPFQAELDKVQANLARDLAQARNAEEEVKRYEDLVKKEYVTQEQYSQIKTNAAALQAGVRASQAAVQSARLDVERCYIRSPLTGKTGNLEVNAGNVVQSNETVLVSINQVKPIYVSFSVPEIHLEEVRRQLAAGNLRAEVLVSGSEEKVAGRFSFIDNSIDPTTGTIRLKATMDNVQGSLWPGQFVDVILILGEQKNAVVVPSQAVQTGQQGDYIYVVNPDMTVALRPVQTGILADQETVIREGVKAGEKVVTDGHLRLKPGAKIEAKISGGAQS